MGTGEKVVLRRTMKANTVYYLQKDGVLYPPLPGYSEHLKNIRNFKCEPDDVWVCGYPKSGNHWVWEIIQMVLKGSPQFATEYMEKYLVDFEKLDSPFLKPVSRRTLVTHLPVKHVPYSMFQKGIKIIYIVRNPKDVVVSSYNHLASVTEDFGRVTFSEYLDLHTKGQVYYGDWYDHVTSWLNTSQANANILIVKYEDMKRDLFSEVMRISNFLRKDLNVETVREISSACTFENMKTKKNEFNDMWRDDGLIRSVYRKGQVGDWRNWFTPEENEAFDAMHKKRMDSCHLQIDFELSTRACVTGDTQYERSSLKSAAD